jgi:hypothetical protein
MAKTKFHDQFQICFEKGMGWGRLRPPPPGPGSAPGLHEFYRLALYIAKMTLISYRQQREAFLYLVTKTNKIQFPLISHQRGVMENLFCGLVSWRKTYFVSPGLAGFQGIC